MKTIDLSIVILNFNTRELLSDCLKSLEKSRLERFAIEVIVVDNASTDDSVSFINSLSKKYSFPLKLIVNNKNLGFAAGNNKGIREGKGKYILLLNSDTQVTENTLINQITFMEDHPHYWVSTCRVELADGNLDPGCHRGFPTVWASFCYFLKLEELLPKWRLFAGYHQGWKNIETIHDIEVISGAFFFAKREVFDKVGLLDEDYFMYAEDIDMCLRVAEKGMKIGFNPETSIIHYKGLSGRKNLKNQSRKQTNKYFWETMKQFYQKHYVNKYPKVIQWLVFKALDWKVTSYE